MKQFLTIVICLFTALTTFAQQYSNEVTITVNGSKNLQITVDGRNYDLTNSTTKGDKTTVAVNNLEVGQHSLQVTRTDQYANITDKISTVFNLRAGYDMLVRVNKNGSLGLIETKRTGEYENMPPMNTANFNNLLTQVRNQRSTVGRNNVLTNAFTNTQHYFTAAQVTELLQQINGESFRLQLAKLSYRSVTDRNNFYQVSDLLNSQESRNELEDYVNNYNQEDNPAGAMSEDNFNTLYQNILQQRPVSTQMNSLTSAFNNTANKFTTYQASRLIQLVTSETNRLQLAKLSYRSITDPNNFYQVNELLYSQASKKDLDAYVKNYNSNSSSQGVAMKDADFNALYQSIQQQRSVSTQMSLLTNAFNNTANYFTTFQASRLIQLVSAESNRLQLAKLSYRSNTDRVNFLQLKDLLYSQAGKNELETYVKNYNSGGTVSVAMSDANFNVLYQNIQQQRPVSTQMNSLTNAFNNTSNYFTAYQASRLIQLVTAENNRLQLAKLSYRSITDRNNFSLVKDLLYSQAGKNELEAFINNDNSGGTAGVAMSDAGFNTLYQTIEDQWPVSTQMSSLTGAFNNSSNYFSSYQASRLIQLVSGDANRLQLAKLSYRSITDRNNFNLVFNTLSNQSSKDELAVFVNNNGTGGSNTRVPMPDAEFNALYQTIFLKFFPNERMNTLTIEFNNTGNNFSSAQAKQLVALVSNESNRLILAKLSYRSITDRNNFSMMYDLLSSEASKDELEAYVKNNSN